MARPNPEQIMALRDAASEVFVGPGWPDDLSDFFFMRVHVDLKNLTNGPTLSVRLGEALTKLDESHFERALDAFEQMYPGATNLQSVITELRRSLRLPQGSAMMDRLRKLEKAGLLVDGLAFMNRRRLRDIVDEICDEYSQARIAVIAGSSLCGKTWSHHLIKAQSRTMDCKLIMLDMKSIQPGNDPKKVWLELLRQLTPDKEDPNPPAEDTTPGPYAKRLAADVCRRWNQWIEPGRAVKPWPFVIIDHLKNYAGQAVLDFAEALAIEASERRFDKARVMLLDFPRILFAPEADTEAMAPREDVKPLTDAEIENYLKEVANTIGCTPSPEFTGQVSMHMKTMLAAADAIPAVEGRRTKLTLMSHLLGQYAKRLAEYCRE